MAEFPLFTICPSFDKAYKWDLLHQDGLSVKDMHSRNFPKDKDSLAYLKKVTHNVSELIKSISFKLADNRDGGLVITYDSDSDLHHKTMEENDGHGGYFGRCFSLKVPQEIKDLKVCRYLKRIKKPINKYYF